MAIPGPSAYSPEWFAYRKYDPSREDRPIVFGASEAASLLGVCPYRSRLDLFAAKTREGESESNLAMKVGHALEPVILGEYAQATHRQLVTSLPMYFSEEYKYLAATPDAVTEDSEIVVDAKTTTSHRYKVEGADHTQFGIEGTDEIPVEYVAQAQQLAAVLNVNEVHFPTMFDNRIVRTYVVKRDDRIITAIAEASEEMAERIMSNDPPEPTFGRPGERDAIWNVFGKLDTVVTLTEDVTEWWIRKAELAEQVKELEQQITELTDRCVHAMQGAGIGILPGYEKNLRRIDVKACSYTVDRKPYSYIREVKRG